jgi:TPR repeat protein
MRISEALVICLTAAAALCGGPALALDAKPQPQSAAPIPLDAFKSVKDAFRLGIQDYNAGNKAGAARSLEYAAQQGHALARWKLGKMYADGDGVPHDDLKAFENFSRIAEENADESPDSPNARFVSSAFVALGSYYLDGIPNTYVKANAFRAREMFQYAASYFGDPDAQYSLARLHLDGQGGPKDPKQALRWLNLSADKGHMAAQALLGQLLFSGDAGVRQKARGLMYLTLARDAADPDRDAWVIDLYNKAMMQASESDRDAGLIFLEQHIRNRR